VLQVGGCAAGLLTAPREKQLSILINFEKYSSQSKGINLRQHLTVPWYKVIREKFMKDELV
jgi:hypothetical protein